MRGFEGRGTVTTFQDNALLYLKTNQEFYVHKPCWVFSKCACSTPPAYAANCMKSLLVFDKKATWKSVNAMLAIGTNHWLHFSGTQFWCLCLAFDCKKLQETAGNARGVDRQIVNLTLPGLHSHMCHTLKHENFPPLPSHALALARSRPWSSPGLAWPSPCPHPALALIKQSSSSVSTLERFTIVKRLLLSPGGFPSRTLSGRSLVGRSRRKKTNLLSRDAASSLLDLSQAATVSSYCTQAAGSYAMLSTPPWGKLVIKLSPLRG